MDARLPMRQAPAPGEVRRRMRYPFVALGHQSVQCVSVTQIGRVLGAVDRSVVSGGLKSGGLKPRAGGHHVQKWWCCSIHFVVKCFSSVRTNSPYQLVLVQFPADMFEDFSADGNSINDGFTDRRI